MTFFDKDIKQPLFLNNDLKNFTKIVPFNYLSKGVSRSFNNVNPLHKIYFKSKTVVQNCTFRRGADCRISLK